MEQHTTHPKLLILRGGSSAVPPELLEHLGDIFEVTSAGSIDEALQILNERHFDAIFSATEDFLPLERASVSQQAVAILNTLGEGVCLVGAEGSILWANRKMSDFSETIQEGVSKRSLQGYHYFEKHFQEEGGEKKSRPRKYSFTDEPSGRYFEMIVTPMCNEKGELTQVATVIWEETASRKLQNRINAIDLAGRELVRLDAESLGKMTVEQRIRLIQDKIVRYAKELLHFDHFVVRILNRETNQLEVLFGVGLEEDEQTQIFANSQHNGITGYVAATGRSYICNNPEQDPHYLPGLDQARCSLTVPLSLHDKVIGTLNVESVQERAFGEGDRQMAEIFGRYIAIALNILDLLVVERYQTTGQAADTLSQQVSEPLNHITTKASTLMEDFIGHDALRHGLQEIIDATMEAKKVLKDVQAGPKGILGSARTQKPKSTELAGKHLLVVDDEDFIRETIADVVQQYGSIVDTAADGKEALAYLQEKTYDLVVSDIKLPHATGYEIFAAAREGDKNIPVILMTGFGYDPNHSIVRANKEGLSSVLYKPFKVDQLMGEIRRALQIEA